MIGYENGEDVFPDDPPMASCNPIKNNVTTCKRLLNVVRSYDTTPFNKCINREVFDKKDPVTGKALRMQGKDYAQCYKQNKIEYVNTNFASIKELQIFNDKILSSNCPNKEGLDIYLLVMSTWAKGKGMTGTVKELMGVPRLTYGLFIRPICNAYAKLKPLIDSYKQQNDTKVIQSDYEIQVWFRELLVKCVDLWEDHVFKMTKKKTNQAFLDMGKNNVDLYFLQGIIMLCMITNTDFSPVFNDYVKIVEHDIDDQGFIPAEARGDKSIDYVLYTLPPIIDTLYYFNLIYGLKVSTGSNLHKKMTRMFYRNINNNLNAVSNPSPSLITEIQNYQRHVVKVNTDNKKIAPLTMYPASSTSLNIKTNDNKEYVMFKNSYGGAFRNHESSYNTRVIADIPDEFKKNNTFLYIKNNPTINRGNKLATFLSIAAAGPIVPTSQVK